jgi:hypothetical protein
VSEFGIFECGHGIFHHLGQQWPSSASTHFSVTDFNLEDLVLAAMEKVWS